MAKMVEMVKSEGRGRPRVKVDSALVLHMREGLLFGWSRMAYEYRRRKGIFISRETMKRRYYEAKNLK